MVAYFLLENNDLYNFLYYIKHRGKFNCFLIPSEDKKESIPKAFGWPEGYSLRHHWIFRFRVNVKIRKEAERSMFYGINHFPLFRKIQEGEKNPFPYNFVMCRSSVCKEGRIE